MNLTDIHQYIVSMFSQGPAIAAALLIGLAGGIAAGSWIAWRIEGSRKKKIEQLKKEKLELETRALTAENALLPTKLEVAEAARKLQESTNDLTAAQDKQSAASGELEAANAKIRQQEADLARIRGGRKLALEKAEAFQKHLLAERARREEAERIAGEKTEELRRADAVITTRQKEIDDAAEAVGRLGARVLELEGQAERAARVQEELTCELETQKEELARSEAERKNSERLYREKLGQHNKLLSHLTKMRAQAGRIWEREVEPSAPRFVPLNERACPITAIMNLKGGVGKTTLAYFIARTLAGQGKRVLLVDLDHQRSLSQAFVSRRQTDALHAQERTLQHFLLSANPAPLGLLKCIEALPSPVDVSIVVSSHASDDGAGLAEAENHLQVDWVARPDSPDIRLLLRQALHGREIHDRFDHILLDCPPRFGTASVNALAASDHLLVPVNLDGSAPLAVAHFLREVKRLRVPAIFPELGLLGVVANRVILHGEDMKVDHREAWRVISGRCKTVWGEPVHMFKAKVRHSAGVGRPATEMACFEDAEGNIASFDAATAEIFTELVNEMLRRMQHASRKLPGVPAESA